MLVALKKINLEHSSEGFPLTSLREIMLLQKLAHKNVVRFVEIAYAKYASPENLLDTAAIPKTSTLIYPYNFYMVCEYMEHSLKGLLEKQVILTVAQVKYVMKQILEGVAFLHSKYVMHRDIKCSNILVNSQGEVKLADFGLGVKFSPKKKLNGKRTVVTLWYRAPELLFGADYTRAIDIWGIGCVFGELILNEALFKGGNEEEQIKLIASALGPIKDENWKGVSSLRLYHKWSKAANTTVDSSQDLASRVNKCRKYIKDNLIIGLIKKL